MLINHTYFTQGTLLIPNLDSQEARDRLDTFIKKYEPKILTDALGYELYIALLNGLQEDPIAQKWLDLLYGKEYTNQSGRLTKWRGIVETVNGVVTINSGAYQYKPPVFVQAGITPGMAPDGNSVIMTDWIGQSLIIERTGAGTMELGVDYSFDSTTGLWSLLKPGDKWSSDERFFVQFQLKQLTVDVSAGDLGQSLIANHVYYWYRRFNATQFSGVGEVVTKGKDDLVGSPAQKMCDTWNEMIDWIEEMYCFLDNHSDTYTEWQSFNRFCASRKFKHINIFF